MRTPALMIALAALGLLPTGCTGTAIKEGVGIATGAKGTLTVLKPIAHDQEARPLGAYERFEMGTMTDGMNGFVPAGLFSALPGAFEKYLEAKKIPNAPSGKTLLIRGRILHYEDSSLVGLALGPVEFVVARVEFVDKGSNRVLGVANCIGRTTQRVNLGVTKKAEGLAKAIVKWIDKRYPKR